MLVDKFPGNVFTDYSSPETIFDSLLLPNPDKNIQLRHVSEVEKRTPAFDVTNSCSVHGRLLTAEQVLKNIKKQTKDKYLFIQIKILQLQL